MALTATGGRPRVLLGFAEALSAPEVVWSLEQAGYEVLAFQRRGARPAIRHARGVQIHEIAVPETDFEACLDELRSLLESVRPDVLLPLDDVSLWLANRPELARAPNAGATGCTAELALDKAKQMRLAASAGFLVPETAVVEDLAGFEPAAYPLVIKAALAVQASGPGLEKPAGAVCANRSEFEAAAARAWSGSVLVQPYIRGSGEGLFGHVGPNGVVAWSAHRRLRMVNPQGSASSACSSLPVDLELATAAEEFLRQARWRGLFMFEFLRDAGGTPWFVELNGRPWGSMALARRRGFEYPAWSVRAALDPGYQPPVPSSPPELVCRHLGMEIAHLAFVLRGPRSAAISGWPSFWRTFVALLRPGRNHALYNWNPHQPRVLLADTWDTVAGYLGRLRGSPA